MTEEIKHLPSQDVADSQRSGDRRLSTCSPLLDFRCTKCLGGGMVMSAPNRWGCSSETSCDECGGRGSVPTEKQITDLSRRLASKLWDCSTLRHGMFTPPEFRRICESVILAALSPENNLLPLGNGEYHAEKSENLQKRS